MKKIILASGSPRRKQLLELAEVPFEMIVSKIDESYPEELSPTQIALYVASNKARAVMRKLSLDGNAEKHTILAADTVVVLENEVIGKPLNRQHAIEILSKLSGI